ncbi:MAG: hypothetical protein ACP5NE_00795 [Candidatus Micrarchaeia archaeon]
MANLKKIIYALIVIIVLAGIAVVLNSSSKSIQIPISNAFVLQLTDPPQVPAGTQALYMSYSGLQLHQLGMGNSTGFIEVNESGTVNLLSLINFTQTIGVANIKPNETFNFVRFNITSAKIEVNNVTYNVSVPNNRLSVRISNYNTSAKGVLIDITPSILEIYSANQTIFLMVPSARAVVIGPSLVNSSSVKVGYKARKVEQENKSLESAKPNISIVSASIAESGNITAITAQVKNNGNSTVVLKGLMVFGNMQTNLGNFIRPMGEAPQMPMQQGNSYGGDFGNFNTSEIEGAVAAISQAEGQNIISNIGLNISGLSHYGIALGQNGSVNITNKTEFDNYLKDMMDHAFANYTSLLGNLSAKEGVNISGISGMNGYENEANSIISDAIEKIQNMQASGHINSSEIESIMSNMTDQLKNLSNKKVYEEEGASIFNRYYHRVLNFIIMPNATLALPFDEKTALGPNGYNLTAGSTVTLSFAGRITYGPENEHAQAPPIITEPIINQTYSIRVFGEDGAYAQANVTAT